jgi:hypothetical protein
MAVSDLVGSLISTFVANSWKVTETCPWKTQIGEFSCCKAQLFELNKKFENIKNINEDSPYLCDPSNCAPIKISVSMILSFVHHQLGKIDPDCETDDTELPTLQ